MKHRPENLAALAAPATLAALLATAGAPAADLTGQATRDAQRLVECMKAFDALCADSLTYTKYFEDHGISREQLDEGTTSVYQKMKSQGARYLNFSLLPPWPPFAVHGRTFVFVPYSLVLEVGGRQATATAFFIGVLDASGAAWKFVDGQSITPQNIGAIIPGYEGATLPPVSLVSPGRQAPPGKQAPAGPPAAGQPAATSP